MSARRRVLHVFATFVPAGPQLRTVELMGALGPDWGHAVAAADGRLEALERLPAGVDARPVRVPRGGIVGMRRLLSAERPDLLCTYNWGSFDAVLAARSLALRPHLHHEDGFNADEARRQKRRRVWTRRLVLRRVRRVIVPSRGLESIARRVWRLPSERVTRVPNGVRLDRFQPAPGAGGEARERLGIPADAWLVGSVGSLRPVKRFDRLIRACHALPAELAARGVHLVILGDGPQRAQLEALARDRPPPGGALHLPGHQAHLPGWYHAMDVFALSSDSEQLPVALLEAMACGVPVAATDVGDLRATLPEEAGESLVPLAPGAGTDDDGAAALASSLGTLLAEPARRERLAALGRARVERDHSHEAMVAAYGELYEGALHEA